MSGDSDTWLSSGVLAERLAARGVRLTPSTIQRYAREGRLPAQVTPGGHYRFDLGEVQAALRARGSLGDRSSSGSPIERLLLAHREAIRAIAESHRGRRIYVFGSAARGEAGPASDIDFLVDFEEGSSLFDLLRMTDELEELLGRSVDVVARGGLKDRDAHILKEAVAL